MFIKKALCIILSLIVFSPSCLCNDKVSDIKNAEGSKNFLRLSERINLLVRGKRNKSIGLFAITAVASILGISIYKMLKKPKEVQPAEKPEEPPKSPEETPSLQERLEKKFLKLNSVDEIEIIKPAYISCFENNKKIENLNLLFDFLFENRNTWIGKSRSCNSNWSDNFFTELYGGEITSSICYETFKLVLEACSNLLLKQSPVVNIDVNVDKIFFVGDFHGVFSTQFKRVIEILSENDNNIVVFTGDYIHRDTNQIEVMFMVAILILYFPNRVFGIMGNHELLSYQGYGSQAGGSSLNLQVELLCKFKSLPDLPDLFYNVLDEENSCFNYKYLSQNHNFIVNFLRSFATAVIVKNNNKVYFACHACPVRFLYEFENLENLVYVLNRLFDKKKELEQIVCSCSNSTHSSFQQKFLDENFFGKDFKNEDFFTDRLDSSNISYLIEIMERLGIEYFIHGHDHSIPTLRYKDSRIFTVLSHVFNEGCGSILINKEGSVEFFKNQII